MFNYFIALICLFSSICIAQVEELAILSNNLIALQECSTISKLPTFSSTLKLFKEGDTFTEYQLGAYKIRLTITDILKEPADAIVNAANSGCLSGGRFKNRDKTIYYSL